LEETFIHDVAQFKFTVTNHDSIPHAVGLRFVQEADNFKNFMDGPILLSDGRTICGEADLGGLSLPEYWRGLPSSGNGTDFGGILRPRGITNGSGFPPTVLPDEVVFGPWGVLLSDAFPSQDHWDFLRNQFAGFNFCTTPDAVAPAVYWNSRQLSPGQSATY